MYSAEFEVFPEFKPKLTRWKSYEESKITVESDDIDLAVADILERYGTWKDVDRAALEKNQVIIDFTGTCLLYTSPSPRDYAASRMPSSA